MSTKVVEPALMARRSRSIQSIAIKNCNSLAMTWRHRQSAERIAHRGLQTDLPQAELEWLWQIPAVGWSQARRYQFLQDLQGAAGNDRRVVFL